MFSVISTAEPVFYFSFNDFKFYNFHLAFFLITSLLRLSIFISQGKKICYFCMFMIAALEFLSDNSNI